MSKLTGDPGYRAGWCIHYGYDRPQMKAVCAVGQDPARWLEDFKANKAAGQTYIDVCPCYLTDQGESRPGAKHCEQLRRPTPEEIAAHDAWNLERMQRHAKVAEAVIPWRKLHKGRNFAQTIECPACKGRLHLSIAGRNSHIHGKCATPGCVEWME
jgi:hypothetical protein